MENTAIPKGHQALMPYFVVPDGAAFRSFLETVFGGSLQLEKFQDNGRLMHAEMVVGGQTVMFGESTSEWQASTCSMFIYVPDADAAYKKALECGAKVLMEPQNQGYGYACGVEDPIGNTWWITQLPE